MKKRRYLLGVVVLYTLTVFSQPIRVQAEEVGGGETTIHIRVPDVHIINLQIGEHGSLRVNNSTYKGNQKINIERLTNPHFEILVDTGYQIDTVFYQGRNVTGEVKKNIYTAPVLHEDDIVFKVSFKKISETSDSHNPSGDDPSSNGNDSSGGGNSSGENAPGNTGSSGSNDENDGNASNENESNKDNDNLKSDNEEVQNNDEKRKNEIINELANIDELLKNTNLSATEKEKLLKKQKELIMKLVEILIDANLKSKDDMKDALDDIDKLLARNDLTPQQRNQLQEKKNSLIKYIEESDEKKDMAVAALVIIVIGVTSGIIYNVYMKKKKSF